MNKKAQVGSLVSIGMGLMIFAIVIGLGLVVVAKMGDNVVSCDTTTGSGTVVNASGWLNQTGYNLNQSSYPYLFVPTVYSLWNATGAEIPLANATYSNGIMYNTTNFIWIGKVNVSYTYTYSNLHTWDTVSQTCLNPQGGDAETGGNVAYTTLAAISTYMGTGGLAGWLPVIIIVLIAGLIMALFGGRKQY